MKSQLLLGFYAGEYDPRFLIYGVDLFCYEGWLYAHNCRNQYDFMPKRNYVFHKVIKNIHDKVISVHDGRITLFV